MKNVELRREGTKLVITVDLAVEGAESSSGKTIVVATTSGNQSVPDADGHKLGLNLYRYKDSKPIEA